MTDSPLPDEWEKLLAQLQSRDDLEKRKALAALVRLKDPRCIPAVAPLLSDPLSEVAFKAIQVLVELRDGSALPALRVALADDRPQVRAAALAGLGRFSKDHYRPAAMEALKDPDPAVRGEAVRLLAQLRDPSLADLFADNLRNEEREQTRVEAALGLGRLRDPKALELAVGSLVNPRAEVRRAAAIALRETRDPASLPPLFQAAAGDDDPLVRKLALEGMRATGDRRILPPAQKALGDRHPDVRQAALEILAQFPDPSHRPFLLGALTDPEEDLAERSARLLGETGDPRSVPELLGLLEDLRPQVRGRAASVLGRLGDPSVIPALGKLVLEETGPPARRALGSLSLLRSHQALPWIVLGLANPDFMVHQESNRLLQEIPYSRIPDLLINSLEDLDPTVRLTAARALGWMKDRGPRPPLTAAGGKTPIRAYVRPLGRRYARSKAARGSRPAWRRPSSWVVCWLGAGFFETPAKDTVLWADRPSSLPPCLPRRLPDPFSAQVRLKRPRLYALDTKLLFLNPSVKKRRAPKPFRSHRPLSQWVPEKIRPDVPNLHLKGVFLKDKLVGAILGRSAKTLKAGPSVIKAGR